MVSKKTRHLSTCSKSATSPAGHWGPNSSGAKTPTPLHTASSALTTCPRSAPPSWDKSSDRCKTTRASSSRPACDRTEPLGAPCSASRAQMASGSLRSCPTGGPTLWTWCTGWTAPRTWFSLRKRICPTRSGRTSPWTFTERTPTCTWAAAWSTASSWTSRSTSTCRLREAACTSQRDPAGRATSGWDAVDALLANHRCLKCLYHIPNYASRVHFIPTKFSGNCSCQSDSLAVVSLCGREAKFRHQITPCV